MTRQDYRLIASVFANVKAMTDEERGMRECLIERMADALARGRPTFQRDTFLSACEYTRDLSIPGIC
jgi:hypothetical protein